MSKHWFIANLIKKYTRDKMLGLDVGVGKNNWLEFKQCKTIGIDLRKEDLPEVVVDLEKSLPFKDGIFDVVISINSLNYIENARHLLIEINRVMKKNATLVCVVDNEKSRSHPHVWEQMYLDRILKVTGFQQILKKNIKDYLYAKWFNMTSVYAFAVVKKQEIIKESYSEKCFKCGKPLGKNWEVDSTTKNSCHISCPISDVKHQWAASYNIKTTHPEG